MSNYAYNDITLNQIYTNSGATGTISGYIGIPAFNSAVPNFNYLKPLTFGYYTNAPGTTTDLRNLVSANTTGVITKSTNEPIPTGCKSIYYIAVGGGAGGSGSGGGAKGTAANGATASDPGGDGGNGGFGTYIAGQYNSVNPTNEKITITIGNGGNFGTNGSNSSVKSNYNWNNVKYNEPKTTAPSGAVGNSGTPTTISINGTTIILSATGGNAGSVGNGAYAQANQYNANANKGNDGTPGNAADSTYGGAAGSTYPNLSNYGAGGIGGTNQQNSSKAATAGTQGAAQIIWLFGP